MELVTQLVRTISFWFLGVLIVSGIIVSGTYYYLRVRQEQLAQTQQQLSQSITQSNVKEGLLLAVKQRAALTNKIVGIQQPIGSVFDTLAMFVSQGQITSVSLDDHSVVVLNIHTQSISETVALVDALMKTVAANRVRAPQLLSLTLGHNGGIDIAVSFIALF